MAHEPNSLLAAALAYAEMGYAVFPCVPGGKTPLTEHGFHDASTDPRQIEAWWARWPTANIGLPTQGLVVIDIDPVDGRPNPWLANEPEKQLDLGAAPMAITPRGGHHHLFRQPPDKNWRCTESKLAPMVDTRADGGYIVVPPSIREDGQVYRWQPTLELEVPPERLPEPPAWLVEQLDHIAQENPSPESLSPGDANPIPSGQRNSTLARLAGGMRRMGMSQAEIAAALVQVNQTRCTPPLSDREVQRIAASIARYEPDTVSVALVENHYAQDFQAAGGENEPPVPAAEDPGPMPDELLRVPGLVNEVMDHCLATAPYPNPVMAFCGALSLQAFLASRRVRDSGDNRTNIYLLGLAHSAAGKDWPRKVNTRIVHEVGLANCLGERFASGEGIQDALFLSPGMLFQTDEIDGMLQSINKAKDARHEAIMSTLLTMYSSANSVFPMRRKAGKDSPGAIDQPCLVIFGTAIPNHYYEALSERMLTNGFFARMIILEAGPRGTGQEPRICDLPPRVLETAKWWAGYRPGTGNLQDFHPVPAVIEHSEEARALLLATREQAETEYTAAEARGDPVGTTVWGRVSEQTRKLALLYAISENHRAPRIGLAAVQWASRFVMHQTRRMLFMAAGHVADGEFDALIKRATEILRQWRERHGRDALMPSWELRRRLKQRPGDFKDIVLELVERHIAHFGTDAGTTKPKSGYRLL